MAKITITEALAEVKTIPARVAKKQEAIMRYFHRDSRMTDPLVKDGGLGSVEFILRERQGIRDLHSRLVRIRCAIQVANHNTMLEVGGVTKTVAQWLGWRREVAGEEGKFLSTMAASVGEIRRQALAKGWGTATPGAVDPSKEYQILINVDEAALAKDVEGHEALLGALDGKLALVNATTLIEVD